MSRFNTTTRRPPVTNLAGGKAYAQSSELELASLLLTSFVNSQYYRSADDQLSRLSELLQSTPLDFSMRALVYARKVMGMRSITHAGASVLASRLSGEPNAARFFKNVVLRTDDVTEILSYHLAQGQKISKAMKKGLGEALSGKDEYSLAKYRGEGKGLKLVDAVNLLHPKHTPALGKLMDGTIQSPDTWEVVLSAAGPNASAKKEAWHRLIAEDRLGYLALLRNLRNITQQGDDVTVLSALEYLTQEDRVRKSRVFPHQLLVAYKQFTGGTSTDRAVRAALEKAATASLANVRNIGFMGNTLVAIDNSGSMDSSVSGGQITCAEAGALFGIALAKACNADIMEFGDSSRLIGYELDDPMLAFATDFTKKNRVGHGTNFASIFKGDKPYDRIVIFSDMQSWRGQTSEALMRYKHRTSSSPFMHCVDLRGYGTAQFPESRVSTVAGYTDNMFTVMKSSEEGADGLVSKIRTYDGY